LSRPLLCQEKGPEGGQGKKAGSFSKEAEHDPTTSQKDGGREGKKAKKKSEKSLHSRQTERNRGVIEECRRVSGGKENSRCLPKTIRKSDDKLLRTVEGMGHKTTAGKPGKTRLGENAGYLSASREERLLSEVTSARTIRKAEGGGESLKRRVSLRSRRPVAERKEAVVALPTRKDGKVEKKSVSKEQTEE